MHAHHTVRTGKYRQGDESRAGLTPPDEVVDDFASFVDSLLDSGHASGQASSSKT
jgi:hypothetical protein